MKPKIYVETTVISYLTSRPSRDLVTAAHQQITQEWWQRRRPSYQLFVSQAVIRESEAGDPEAAERRVETLRDIPLLELNENVTELAGELLAQIPLPQKAALDAVHIAVAVVHGMDYLMNWNCTHLANASLRGRIDTVCLSRGYEPPVICTPEELMED